MTRLPDAAPRTAGKPRAFVLLGAALLAAVAAAAFVAPWRTAKNVPAVADMAVAAPETARVLADAAAQRPVYKYSILPGGAGSRGELAAKAAEDKVAAAHYASFEIDKAHVTVVPRARAVHVSYRKGDRVYWTKRKVMLAPGETLLSDGRSTMRTRCGNRISETPQLPVEPGGPDEGELDQIVPAGMPVPEGGAPRSPGSFAAGPGPAPESPGGPSIPAGLMPGPGGFGGPGGGPLYFPGGGSPGSPSGPGPGDGTPTDGTPTDGTPGDPRPLLPPAPRPPEPLPGTPERPAEVPEPGTLWLGLAGAGALLLRRRGRR